MFRVQVSGWPIRMFSFFGRYTFLTDVLSSAWLFPEGPPGLRDEEWVVSQNTDPAPYVKLFETLFKRQVLSPVVQFSTV